MSAWEKVRFFCLPSCKAMKQPRRRDLMFLLPLEKRGKGEFFVGIEES